MEESDFEQASMLVMSLCGGLLQPNMSEAQVGELVEAHRVSYSDFAADPNLLFRPDVLFCIDDRLVEFRIAAPFVMSTLAFGTPLDVDLLSTQMVAPLAMPTGGGVSGSDGGGLDGGGDGPSPPLRNAGAQKEGIKSGGRFGWFGWSRSSTAPTAPVGEPLLSEEDLLALEGTPADSADMTPTPAERDDGKGGSAGRSAELEELWEVTGGGVPNRSADSASRRTTLGTNGGGDAAVSPHVSADTVAGSGRDVARGVVALDAPQEHRQEQQQQQQQQQQLQAEEMNPIFDPNNTCLSLVASPEQLAELDLQPGANSIRFIVESSAAEVECRIFLWGPDVKVVISDVDGTITRSDVLGHVLPAVGRDWSHVGVAGLYTEIAKHGYKFMYLTARPIGMASTTRDFLHSVTQGGARLPNGPVLMSPNRLVESFTREVIRRKPQEFKIGALREVRSLFTMDYNPFHAGFGNRETDVISYRAVGLIPHRIFVVNASAELVVNSVRYESAASYSSLRDLVNSVFPDIHGKVGREHVHNVTDGASFNSWNFWKPKLPEVDLDALLARNG
jgi:hypothetical protein